MNKSIIRVIMPDSHGNHIDEEAKHAFLADVKHLNPDEIVCLGDHLDCGGTFNSHQRNYTHEMTESYEDDVAAANSLFNSLQIRAPRARIHYIEGNHEAHVERWASRMFASHKDAVGLLDKYGPESVLHLKKRGISYYKRSELYMGLAIQGTIKLGKCFFTHGICASKHATATHLERFGDNVVHGHTHRAQAIIGRTVSKACIGAWCPGTLAKQQPLYQHTNPTNWTHGYGVQFIRPSGAFIHINVPIYQGTSQLKDVAERLA